MFVFWGIMCKNKTKYILLSKEFNINYIIKRLLNTLNYIDNKEVFFNLSESIFINLQKSNSILQNNCYFLDDAILNIMTNKKLYINYTFNFNEKDNKGFIIDIENKYIKLYNFNYLIDFSSTNSLTFKFNNYFN